MIRKKAIRLRKTLLKIIKFFTTSLFATGVDFGVYTFLLLFIGPVFAHFFSATSGMVVNFILQRKWVFDAKRELGTSFILSFFFSIVGIFLGGLLIYLLTYFSFFATHLLWAKVVVIGVLFFYNFVTKKIAFGDK